MPTSALGRRYNDLMWPASINSSGGWLEAEVDEAIAVCGGDARAALRATLIANAYLEAEIERLAEAISTGFARGRIRKPSSKSRR